MTERRLAFLPPRRPGRVSEEGWWAARRRSLRLLVTVDCLRFDERGSKRWKWNGTGFYFGGETPVFQWRLMGMNVGKEILTD